MTHDPDTEAYIDECIGPRVIGTYYRSSFDDNVTVLAIDRDPPGWMLWSITEANDDELARGASRTHCTRWDPRRDRVIR